MSPDSSPRTRTIPLCDGWRFREAPAPTASPTLALPWLPATVPGHVHDDLVRGGVLAEPFRRMNERGVQWVDEADWEYETTFEWIEGQGDASIRFDGLDTVAEVYLNETPLGATDNMLVPVELAVTGALRTGENTVRVLFRSARRVGRERQEAWNASGEDTMPRTWNVWDERAFVRKAQYMYGWDWGPELASCGIWRPVSLVVTPIARIMDWRHEVSFAEDGSATVRFEVFALRASGQEETPVRLVVAVAGRTTEVDLATGGGRVSGEAVIRIENAVRWEPSGSGSPHLYGVALTLLADGDTVDESTASIGLRAIELMREAEEDGEGFRFRVNGKETFMKGANWVPADSFPSRLEHPEGRKRVRRLLEMARDAGLNMLRVWGGGLYESDDFYEFCDEYGILVWQDFPYACAYYPDTGAYAEAARMEAICAVRRLRNHASLALWCGNNENHVMFHEGWGGPKPPRYLGESIYHDVLPQVVTQEDPTRTYWPSSPFGGHNPNSQDHGDRHNWDVWHGSGDWTRYAEDRSRFVSEFGFAASPGLAAWATVLDDDDRGADSPAVRWHDKTRKGYDTYLGYIETFFPRPESLEDLVYYSQVNQAEALKFGVEHCRRWQGRCWGTLFWQWNDCWPVQSWAVVDYLGEAKLAYHAARRFYAPLMVSLVHEKDSAAAWLTHDGDGVVPGTLTLTLETFDGETLGRVESNASAPRNGSTEVGRVDLSAAVGREAGVFVRARFQPVAGDAAENILFLVKPRDLALPDPGTVVTGIAEAGDGAFAVTMKASRFAAWVWLQTDGFGAPPEWSDNGFHLVPGQERTVTVRVPAGTSDDQVRHRIRVRTMAAC